MFSLCVLQAEDRKVLWSAETEVKLTLLPRLFRQPSPERRLTADRWAACVLWYRLFCFSVKFFFWMQRCLLVFPVRFLASYRCILRMGAGISMSGLPSSAIANLAFRHPPLALEPVFSWCLPISPRSENPLPGSCLSGDFFFVPFWKSFYSAFQDFVFELSP